MAISITPSPFGSVTVTLDGELGGVLSVGVLATSNSALNMDLGVPGPQGEAGEPGANGVGVPTGGSAGQVLAKIDGTNYNTEWVDAGAAGDYLPLAGGSMTGDIIWPAVGTGSDTAIGTFGFGTENLTLGQTAYVEPNNIVSTLYVQPNLPDAPLGYTKSVTINADGIVANQNDPNVGDYGFTLNNSGIYGVNNSENVWSINTTGVYGGLTGAGSDTYFTLNSDGFTSGNQNDNGVGFTKALGLRFSDATYQTSAFPPAGGTTAQYIDGTGALQTLPTHAETLQATVRNNTGATLAPFTVVYISGALGNKATVAKAQANTEATSSGTFAITEASIANNADGTVIAAGVLSNVNTSAYTDGDKLYLSPSVAGGVTTTKPSAPDNLVYIGVVTRSHPTLGTVNVRIQNGFELNELHDVAITSIANNDSLFYDSATSLWKNKTPTNARTALGLGTMATATASDYLAKADNLSGLASTSTARTNLGLGAVSTDAYATTAQAQAGTSTTTVVSPSTLLDAKYFSGGKGLNTLVWSTQSSGTGASSGQLQMNGRQVTAPTSATGYAQSYGSILNNTRGSAYTSGIDWSKRVVFGGRFARNVTTPDSNSSMRFGLGRSGSQVPSDILSTDKQVGIKVSGSGAIVLYAANGSALSTVTSSFTPSNASAYDVVIVSDGAGNVTLYVNGSSVATSTGGPTSAQGSVYYSITFETQNSTTLTNGAMVVIGSDFFVQVNS